MFELFIAPKAMKKIVKSVNKQYGEDFYQVIKDLRNDKVRDGYKAQSQGGSE